MITVYTTCKDEEEAQRIARGILLKHLAACANIFPIGSIYWWKNRLHEKAEFVILLKTDKPFEAVASEIKKLHSYDVPCIEKINVTANSEYEDWVKSVTSKD